MTGKIGKYSGDQLFHAISHDKDPTRVNFIYFPHHKVEATQVLNCLLCIISEDILINANDFITRSGIYRATMGIWDKEKRPSQTQMSYTMRNECKSFLKAQVSRH